MTNPIGFQMEPIILSISDLVPGRPLDIKRMAGKKYSRILASIREVGVIEMPLVHKRPDGNYEIVDGHLRIEALRNLGVQQVRCLVTNERERFSVSTYYSKVTAIQEHYMISKAVSQGVSEERLARALQIDIKRIQEKKYLLQGICQEVINLLEKTIVSAATIAALRKVVPERQIEIAEMMVAANNFSVPFCRGLLLATRKEQLIDGGASKKKIDDKTDYIALVKMQEELEVLQRDMQVYEDTYGQNFLNLVVVRGYLAKLLGNDCITRFLNERYPEIESAMRHIVDSVSIEG
jgi:hypothetical protein